MNNPPPPPALLEAVAFAARAHQGQLRKDGRTPYVSHVFRVCLVLRQTFGIDDDAVLTASVLHDTIEDTTTDFDDLAELFGPQVAGWVALLSKDKRQQDGLREEAYKKGLASTPWQVKACKLADVYDNLLDSAHLSPEKRHRTVERSRGYLKALDDPTLPPPIRRAFEIVQRQLDDLEGKP
jgi:guanosine-3',5'-bis(diphosphate) 3'-pyrophosphohydrolase